MASCLFLCILSLAIATTMSRRTLLQDNGEDLQRKQISEKQDLFEIPSQMDRVDDDTAVGEAIAIAVTVVVCIGFLAGVIGLVYCCCCLPCCILTSRARSRGHLYQRAPPPNSPRRSEYPRQPLAPQQQPSMGLYQPSGFYPPPPPAQQIPMESYPTSLPPPYPGPPAGSLQPHQDPYNYNYMEKQDCKISE